MMTESQYPPLPEPAYTRVGIDVMAGDTPSRMQQVPIQINGVQAFTADQMHAYIDADRAQRKPLTAFSSAYPIDDKGCIDPLDSRMFYELCQAYRHDKTSAVRSFGILRDWLQETFNTPPRPDAGNN